MLQTTPHATLKTTPNPLLAPQRPTVAGFDQELRRLPHLDGDRGISIRHTRHTFKDATKARTAAEALDNRLPDADEDRHLAISGRFALFHFISAVLDLSAQPAVELWVVTLSFSKRNVDDIASMLDAGRVSRLWFLCSHYFSKTSTPTYDHARHTFATRPAATFTSLRVHAKIVLLKVADGRTFSIESSANLRSAKSIEQATVFGQPAVYEFHRQWIGELFAASKGRA